MKDKKSASTESQTERRPQPKKRDLTLKVQSKIRAGARGEGR